jgi:hypothetical protein
MSEDDYEQLQRDIEAEDDETEVATKVECIRNQEEFIRNTIKNQKDDSDSDSLDNEVTVGICPICMETFRNRALIDDCFRKLY